MAKRSAATLSDVTARVLDRFTAQGMLFTALDVSNAVKDTLPDVRHREVSPLVRAAYDDDALGPYQATQIDVNAGGKTVQALLYHLPNQDPTQYDDSMRSQLAKAPRGVADDQVSDVKIEEDTLGASVPVGQDGRGRVSRRLLANAGIEGDEVWVLVKKSPAGIELYAEDVDDDQLADQLEEEGELVSCAHPDLLHLTGEQLQVFPSVASLAARVEGNKVIIGSTTYSAPAGDTGGGLMPYPVIWS